MQTVNQFIDHDNLRSLDRYPTLPLCLSVRPQLLTRETARATKVVEVSLQMPQQDEVKVAYIMSVCSSVSSLINFNTGASYEDD